MNDILRLISRALRPFGYDIRKRNTHNLSPLKGIPPLASLERVRRDFSYDREIERSEVANLDVLKIVFRTCLNAERNKKSHGLIASASLSDTVTRCFLSLVSSINDALEEPNSPQIELIILDDHSDADAIKPISEIAARLNCSWKLQTTTTQGQGASLHQQFSMARNDDSLYYFCEDDYLHERSAVFEMFSFYRQIFQLTRRHLVLHPQEHESLYDSSFYPSYLVLSPFRHWRSVSDATHVLFTHSHVLREHWEFFENTKFVGNRNKRHLGSERRTTNQLFQYLPGFVPIPALAGHLQSAHLLPPFFDWRTLWDANDPNV